jgi:hypothetical protein
MFKQLKLMAGLAITATLVACGGGGDSGTGEQPSPTVSATTIATTGGTASANAGAVSVSFPADTFAKSTTVTITPTVNFPSNPSIVQGTSYEFGPSGAFAKTATLRIKYAPENLPKGALENYLAIYTVENGKWVKVAGSTVDTALKSVSAPINHFSTWGVFAENHFQAQPDERYEGTYSGTARGTWTGTIDAYGDFNGSVDNGRVIATGRINFDGDTKIDLSGKVTGDCRTTFNGTATYIDGTRATLSGTWSDDPALDATCGGRGIWSGQKVTN